MKLRQHFMAATMSAALALSVAAPAFALQNLEIKSTMRTPTINIVLPTNVGVVLNPYGMTVEDTDLAIEAQTGQIISPTMYVQNLTEAPVRVESMASATAAGGATVVDAAPEDSTTEKQIYIGVGYQFTDDTSTAVEYDANDVVADTAATDGTVGSDVLVSEAAFLPGLESTDEQTENEYGVNVFQSAYNGNEAGTYLAFKMAGKMTKTPATPWNESDSLSVALVFNFVPVNMPETVTVALADPTAVAANADITVTAPTPSGATEIPDDVTLSDHKWTVEDTTNFPLKTGTNNTSATLQLTPPNASKTSTVTWKAKGSDGKIYTATCTVKTNA